MKIVIKKSLERKKGSTLDCGPGLTEQSHKQATDINYILRDYAKTGLMKHVKNHEGVYDDVSVSDFQDAMFKVKKAQNMFDELPSNIRKRFGNDPAEFLGFVQNPNNVEEMNKLGILSGNDGIDLSGAQTTAPTKAHYDQLIAKNNASTTETASEPVA
jgi:phage internal scaffolding protein